MFIRASLTLQETRSIHDSMNLPKIEFISLRANTLSQNFQKTNIEQGRWLDI